MKKQKKNQPPRLGLDFGRVIIGAVKDGKADTSFLGSTLEQAMNSPATEGAFESVRTLVDLFDGEVWIVSKCGPSVEKKSRAWLKHHNFYRETGLKRENLRFCLKRPQKTPICNQLGITHFVDDRGDVLEFMVGSVPNLYLFGEQPEGYAVPDFAIEALDWQMTVDRISESLCSVA